MSDVKSQDYKQATIEDRNPIVNINSTEKKMYMIQEDEKSYNEMDD